MVNDHAPPTPRRQQKRRRLDTVFEEAMAEVAEEILREEVDRMVREIASEALDKPVEAPPLPPPPVSTTSLKE